MSTKRYPPEGSRPASPAEKPDLSSLPGVAYRRTVGEESTLRYCSDYVEELFDYSPKELLTEPKMPFYRLVHPQDRDRVRQAIQQSLRDDASFHLDYRMLTRNKQTTSVIDRGRIIDPPDPDKATPTEESGVIEGIITPNTTQPNQKLFPSEGPIERDHTSKKYDGLTNLPNRHWFLEQVDARLQSFEADDADQDGFILALIDLDEFQRMNNLHGRDAGDYVIKTIAEVLRKQFGDIGLVGRMSGDRFGVLLPSDVADDVETFFRERLEPLERDFVYDEQSIHQDFSLGVAVYPEHGTTLEDLTTSVNRALNRGKSDVKTSITVFDESDRNSLEAKRNAHEQVLEALENDRINPYYQPVKNARNNTNVMHEALLRFENEAGQPLEVQSLKELLDDDSITRRIDRWMIERSIRDFSDRIGTDRFPRLAVNMFPSTIVDPESFPEIHELLLEYEFPIENFVVEIPETLMLSHREQATENIRRASEEFGFLFALDDFGVGHGSFKSLNSLPVDYLKIDGSFVKNLPENQIEQTFVEMAVGLSRKMDLQIIAEWIETRRTAELLKTLGVSYQQGYYHSDPAPIDELRT